MRIEREHLLPLSAEGFDLAETSFPSVDGKGCVKVRTNFYSTPLRPGTSARVKLLPAYVEIWEERECVARHERSFGRYQQVARELPPTQGRWISPDPSGLAALNFTNPQSLNRYAYLLNQPLNSVDPAGVYGALVFAASESDWIWYASGGAGGGMSSDEFATLGFGDSPSDGGGDQPPVDISGWDGSAQSYFYSAEYNGPAPTAMDFEAYNSQQFWGDKIYDLAARQLAHPCGFQRGGYVHPLSGSRLFSETFTPPGDVMRAPFALLSESFYFCRSVLFTVVLYGIWRWHMDASHNNPE
jgi:RHS repeat-associated protein